MIRRTLLIFWFSASAFCEDPKARDFYQRFGLRPPVTESQVLERHRELVRRTHPDVGGDIDDFKAIEEAFEALMKVAKKDHSLSPKQIERQLATTKDPSRFAWLLTQLKDPAVIVERLKGEEVRFLEMKPSVADLKILTGWLPTSVKKGAGYDELRATQHRLFEKVTGSSQGASEMLDGYLNPATFYERLTFCRKSFSRVR